MWAGEILPDWEPAFLRDDLFFSHSLQIADFSGNGWLDISVAEMGGNEKQDTPTADVFEQRRRQIRGKNNQSWSRNPRTKGRRYRRGRLDPPRR